MLDAPADAPSSARLRIGHRAREEGRSRSGDPTVGNIQDFHAAVTAGQPLSDTLRPSLESNFAAILGRRAAWLGRPVTWDELMKDPERIDPKLQLPKDGPTSSA
jgi:hypothetical protein